MNRAIITLAICAGVGALCGWPLACLMATFSLLVSEEGRYSLGMGGYPSPLDNGVLFFLFGLGMSICLGLLVGAVICGVRAAVPTGRAGKDLTVLKTRSPLQRRTTEHA